jgi:hypothetical protein
MREAMASTVRADITPATYSVPMSWISDADMFVPVYVLRTRDASSKDTRR